jgi:glutathione S-transferase
LIYQKSGQTGFSRSIPQARSPRSSTPESVAELTYAPFFKRYALNHYFWGYAIPPRLPQVERWRRGVLDHDAVKTTSLRPDQYIKLYALGFANGAIPPGHERSALDPEIPLDARPLPPRRV